MDATDCQPGTPPGWFVCGRPANLGGQPRRGGQLVVCSSYADDHRGCGGSWLGRTGAAITTDDHAAGCSIGIPMPALSATRSTLDWTGSSRLVRFGRCAARWLVSSSRPPQCCKARAPDMRSERLELVSRSRSPGGIDFHRATNHCPFCSRHLIVCCCRFAAGSYKSRTTASWNLLLPTNLQLQSTGGRCRPRSARPD